MSATPRPDTWMPFYIGDYLADTMHLTRDQHGAYVLLIMAYWRNGGPLADDDTALAAIVRAGTSEWRKLRRAMESFFRVADGHWHHKRIDKELSEAGEAYSRRKARSDAANAAKGTAKQPYKPPDADTAKGTLTAPDKDALSDTSSRAGASQPQPQSSSKKETQSAERPNLDAARDPLRNGHEPEPPRPRQPPGRPSAAATAIAGIASARSRPR